MATIAEKKEQRKKLLDDAAALAVVENLTDEQKAGVDKMIADAETLRADIDRIEKIEAARKSLEATETRKSDPIEPTKEPVHAEPKKDEPWLSGYYGGLRAYKNTTDGRKAAYQAGQWIRATLLGNRSAQKWCENNLPEYRAMSENTNTAGGYLVPEVLANTIVDLREQYGIVRQNVQVVPMSSDKLMIPRRAGGVTAAFLGESGSITTSDPTFNMVELSAKKLGAGTVIPTELIDDAIINVADWVANEIAYAFAKKEDECVFLGNGTTTYGGINGLANKLAGTIGAGQLAGAVDAASGHDTFAEIDQTDLVTMMAKLPQYARAGAKFYCSATAYDLVFQRLAATIGGNTIQTLGGGFGPSYLGYPIVISQVLPTSTGDLSDLPMLYFGNLPMACVMGTRRDLRLVTSTERYVEYDQVAIYGTERFDVNLHSVGDTSTAGPILALIGE